MVSGQGSGLSVVCLRNPLSIVVIAVIVLGGVAAGLLASELCAPRPQANVSFGATPLLVALDDRPVRRSLTRSGQEAA
jgi:hypothetical protein